MPEDEYQAGGAEGASGSATPSGPDGRPLPPESGRLARAAVEAAGEVGYHELTVAQIIERAGANRTAFYRLYDGKADCYAAGYVVAVDDLVGRMLASGREAAGWREGFGSALDQLAGFAIGAPLYASGVLTQARIAGGPVSAKRLEVLERLSRAVDTARRETSSRHSPPPIAARFIVGAIEETLVGTLARGRVEDFGAAVPDLVQLAVGTYFGA
jgi:AcrR family transcriptional regulator